MKRNQDANDHEIEIIKKQRRFNNESTNLSKPSKVVFVRGLSPEISEVDVIQLCGSMGGNVTNTLFLPHKNQAFIELEALESSSKLVNYYSTHPVKLLGRNIFLSFANIAKIKHKQPTQFLASQSFQSSQSSELAGFQQSVTQTIPSHHSPVLHVAISNVLIPVTISLLKSVFETCGSLLKIIILPSNQPQSTLSSTHNSFQTPHNEASKAISALVQLDSLSATALAFQNLQGKNIYEGCNNMVISYANKPTISVRYDGPTSWDFTKPNALIKFTTFLQNQEIRQQNDMFSPDMTSIAMEDTTEEIARVLKLRLLSEHSLTLTHKE